MGLEQTFTSITVALCDCTEVWGGLGGTGCKQRARTSAGGDIARAALQSARMTMHSVILSATEALNVCAKLACPACVLF